MTRDDVNPCDSVQDHVDHVDSVDRVAGERLPLPPLSEVFLFAPTGAEKLRPGQVKHGENKGNQRTGASSILIHKLCNASHFKHRV